MKKDYDTAAQQYEKLRQHDTKNADVSLQLGLIYQQSRQYDKALNLFKDSLRLATGGIE